MVLVPGVAETFDRVRALGGTTLLDPRPFEGTTMAFVVSPVGQAVGLLEGDDAIYRTSIGQRELPPYP